MNQPQKKIAIFINSLAGGGAERVTSYLLPYLVNKGHAVVLVLTEEELAYPVPKEVPIHYLDKSGKNESGVAKLLKLPWLAYRYAHFLRNENITHSFSLLTRPCYINIMARWFTSHPYKLMVSERNFPSMQYGGNHLQARINNFLVKRLYPKADLVVSNAKASAQDLVDNFGVAKERTRTIYNPIDIDKIQQMEAIQDFFDSNYVNAVSIGRLVPEKNHTFLLDAVLPFNHLRLYIFGEGELRKSLEEKIQGLGLENRVFLMGFESNPFQYLKAADFFLFGSLNEGFPNVLMEAMCCGLPIVSTNCKSGPDEMMELNESKTDDIMFTDYGILTPVNDVACMQKALEYVLEHPEFLQACKPNLLQRIQDFRREPILEAYHQLITS
ncbi:glycosyltransferase [Allomuricauda sp. ARW1Y1]|jgi:N-acetylgalactosamine-N,N'-diacetylbacillosaminyl-diphospho-undecaprenol 4-alpha-N-acetylgalactosaminyltransferase|uniref:glycosyltransferase n=1 Tax=Allomuricauda sp. ARW1Y1 TaxID=2663843 RepID=UPI0015C856B4|nr:glycosyltransferase [Muricauda sp. ARW1Y1]NYJ28034.1 N-acetylgalactosamine-N,N'-diacetylbacillosaminyl-diphospho-undecaprenol 4-alpha-N-acetylgalactosaminyltransferase [Muricauda sp. ARW1Y1]